MGQIVWVTNLVQSLINCVIWDKLFNKSVSPWMLQFPYQQNGGNIHLGGSCLKYFKQCLTEWEDTDKKDWYYKQVESLIKLLCSSAKLLKAILTFVNKFHRQTLYFYLNSNSKATLASAAQYKSFCIKICQWSSANKMAGRDSSASQNVWVIKVKHTQPLWRQNF